MGIPISPLRYPGGKSVLARLISDSIQRSCKCPTTYIEPFAGGAAVGLYLLISESVDKIVINDADPCVYAFWTTILTRKNDFIKRLINLPINIDEWHRQRSIYRNQSQASLIAKAVAFFYLNRSNRSGILANGGPIGGLNQSGKWTISARFNKIALIHRIERIFHYRERITVLNADGVSLLKMYSDKASTDNNQYFAYLDPPYYEKGQRLYMNFYKHEDHLNLAKYICNEKQIKWILTYDNVKAIRDFYAKCVCTPFNISYCASGRGNGKELLIRQPDIPINLDFLP